MTDLTYEQNINMQATAEDPVKFLAHALVPRRWAWTERIGDSFRIRLHRSYEYSSATAEETEAYLTKHKTNKLLPLLHAIILQWMQSCMMYYKQQFPDLFRPSDKEGKHNPLIATVGTINAVMKYAGYSRQQEVFESNAISVLEILNTMAKEAHEIEKMTPKKKNK